MPRLATTVVIILLSALPARAQDRLFEGSRELGAIGHFGTELGPAPALVHNPRIGGGRFVINGDVVVDLRSGAEAPLGPGSLVAYDRVRPRVFMARTDGVWQVDVVTRAALLALPGPTAQLVDCVHAYSADVLFCAFTRPDGLQDIVTPSAAGPRLVVTTRVALPPNWVVTPDASRLYYNRCTAVLPGPFQGCRASDISMIEVSTGAVTSVDTGDALDRTGALRWDEVNERLLALGSRIHVYTKDLVSLGSMSIGARCRQIGISPHTGRLYLNRMDYYYSPPWSTLTAFDSTSYQVLTPPVIRSAGYSCGPLTLLTAPGPPRALQATVSGRNVSLTRTNVGGASGFVLDVGFGHGRTDLQVFLGPTPRATFVDVPPGTYYLRLKGSNEFGGGRASEEIHVTVQ